MHRLDGVQILAGNPLDVPSPLLHIPDRPAEDPLVGVSLDVDLDVEEVPQLRLRQHQDPLDEDDRAGLDVQGLLRTVVDGEVIDRAVNRQPVPEAAEVLHQKGSLEGVRVVVIALFPLLHRDAVISAVIVIVVKDGDPVPEQAL